MEPVSLILTALLMGATAAAQSIGSQAIKDTYQGLKILIQRRFADHEKAQSTLTEYQEDPETYEKPMIKQLIVTGADQDKEIISAAQKLMALLEPEQVASGRFNVQAGGNIYGIAQDTKGNITQTFTFDQSLTEDKPKIG